MPVVVEFESVAVQPEAESLVAEAAEQAVVVPVVVEFELVAVQPVAE